MQQRLGFLVAAVALALGGVPAAAATDTASPPGIADLAQRAPASALTVSSGPDGARVALPTARPEDLILDLVQDRSREGVGHAMRRFAAEHWGLTTPAVATAAEEDPEPEPPAEPGTPAEGVLGWAYPGGDLTGDGREDVMLISGALAAETITLEALRGSDGARLWSLPLSADDALPLPVGDLTGDGIYDALLWSWSLHAVEVVEDSCDGDTCVYEDRWFYSWQAGLRSGADGSLLWLRSYDGEDRLRQESHRGLEYRDSLTYDATYPLVLPLASDDHTGDGSAELVLNIAEDVSYERSVEGVDAMAVWTADREERLRTTTTAELVHGGSGTTVLTQGAAGNASGLLWPVGDLTGDGTGDLAWEWAELTDGDSSCLYVLGLPNCSGERASHSFRLEVLDGATLEPAWTHQVDGFAFFLPIGADLTGDGRGDLALFGFDQSAWPFTTTVLAGADGAELWSVADDSWWRFPVAIGAFDGGPASDVAVVSIDWGDFPIEDDPSFVISRRRGSTGEVLLQTTRQLGADNENWLAYVALAGDTDGDGVADFVGGTIGFDVEEDDEAWRITDVSHDLYTESGREGSDLFTLAGEGERWLGWEADLTGDGTGEVRDLAVHDSNDWDSPATHAAWTLAGDEPAQLWTYDAEVWWEAPWAAGDQDGVPGEELLLNRNTLTDGRWSYQGASLSGSDLALRWSASRD